MLTVAAVEVAFRDTAILSGVTAELGLGVTALVGPNGAGKTTLIRVLASVLQPRSGHVRWRGASIWDSPAVLTDLRRSSGWVPQSVGLPPGLRVEAFLDYAAWLKEVPASDRAGRVDSALTRTDIGHLRGRRLGQLSGGEQRRVTLAAALVNEPAVLLLDEPTVGLDPDQRERFLAVVSEVGQDTTVLLSTHLLEDVAICGQTLLGMSHGDLVVRQELAAPSLAELREVMRDVFTGAG